jgi:hypothetical protein
MRMSPSRFTIRRLMLAVALTAVLMAYFVTYYRLSRREVREASELGVPGLLHVSAEDAKEKQGLLIALHFHGPVCTRQLARQQASRNARADYMLHVTLGLTRTVDRLNH